MNRTTLLTLLAGLLAVACTPAETPVQRDIGNAGDKLNIILIVTDDQGNGDIGVNGNPAIRTPNLDQLAGDSISFTDFHVDPTCSPTRAALMTGKHSMRAGVWHTIMGRSLLPAEQTTLAELLQAKGYRTAMFGKWHLGDNFPFRPQDQGFDEVLIHGGGGVGQTPDYWGNTQFNDTYFRNGESETFAGYATKVWFDEAIRFIREERNEPFFAYIATNAPHQPWRAPAEYVEPYLAAGLPENMAKFYAMTTYVDEQVGRLRREVQDTGLADNTILIFMTDNGSALSSSDRYYGDEGFSGFFDRVSARPEFSSWSFNAGLRGFKAEVYEGGHRVPLYILAPKQLLGAARNVDTLSAHFDLMPTLLDIVGADIPGDLDGTSLVPSLTGEEVAPERTLVITNQRVDIPSLDRPHVVMNERWRYVSWGENGVEELYDIVKDPGQQHNVIGQQNEVAAAMRQALTAWWQDAIVAGFERQRIVVGDSRENPARLSAMDWMEASTTNDVPWFPGFGTPDPELPHTGWMGRENLFGSLPWYIEVATAGDYTIDLYLHDKPAATPVMMNYAILEINGVRHVRSVSPWTPHAAFSVPLAAGHTQFKGWFTNDPEAESGSIPAFFAYVELH